MEDRGQALTNWRTEDMLCQQAQNEHTDPGTHTLESRGCSVLEGAKQKDRRQALTPWRSEDVMCQQAQNGGTEGRHSPTEEQRMWSVSRHKTEGQRAGTHTLKSRGHGVSAGSQRRDQGQALHQLESRGCGLSAGTKQSDLGQALHQLESRRHGVSAGAKWRDRGQALTNWRAEDMVCQQAQNRGTNGRHSPTGKQRT
jgi:hypothetical protein